MPPKSSLIQRAATSTETRAAPAARNARTADWACPPRAHVSSTSSTWAPAGSGAAARKCRGVEIPRVLHVVRGGQDGLAPGG